MEEYLRYHDEENKEKHESDEPEKKKEPQQKEKDPEEPSVFSKKPANYIVKVRRGNEVTHAWEFENTIIKYNETAKGWEIITNRKAHVFITGDIEIWRIEPKPVKPKPPEPKKEPFTIGLPCKKKHKETIKPPTSVREIYEMLYQTFDIKSLLFPPKNKD